MCRILDYRNDSLELFGGDITSSAHSSVYSCSVEIDIGLLADKVGVSSAHPLDSGQGIHDLLFSIDVGIEKTQDELKVRLLATDESCITILAYIQGQPILFKCSGFSAL